MLLFQTVVKEILSYVLVLFFTRVTAASAIFYAGNLTFKLIIFKLSYLRNCLIVHFVEICTVYAK